MQLIKIRRILFLTTLIVVLLCSYSSAQVYNWKRLKYEGYIGLGATNFIGDAGAKEDLVFRNVWVNPQAIRYVMQVGGRMALDPRQKIRVNLAVGMLYNDDRYGDWPERFLQFRSPIIELSGMYEYFIIREHKKRTRYKWLNLPKKIRNKIPGTYLFGGVAAIFFNPQAYTNGKWHNLHPLHTEGQGLPGYNKHYSRISVAFPVGIGMKFKLTPYRSIGIEAGWRFAMTDYIDDIGAGRYPSTQTMLDNFGETAAILSYRGHGRTNSYDINYKGGERRGGPWFDQYQFILINYSAVLKTNRKGRPRLDFY